VTAQVEVLDTSRLYAHADQDRFTTQEQYKLLFLLLLHQIPTVPTTSVTNQTQQ
jgi:hypothetical protein